MNTDVFCIYFIITIFYVHIIYYFHYTPFNWDGIGIKKRFSGRKLDVVISKIRVNVKMAMALFRHGKQNRYDSHFRQLLFGNHVQM